jgi:RHS repeat-associated protein
MPQETSPTETKIYSGLYEKVTEEKTTRELHYIPTPNGTVAVHIRANGVGTTYYLLKDYLGSIMKVVTAAGSTIEEHSYDAWGNHRNPANWTLSYFSSPLGLRGYTGHEMLPLFQLINMNGRMYDPVIGRVLSPDNYVPNATNAQDFNRYSYARNNPLKYTDPDGEFVWLPIIIGAAIGAFTGGAMADMNGKNVGTGIIVGGVVGGLSGLAGVGASALQTAWGIGGGVVPGAFYGALTGASIGAVAGGTTAALLKTDVWEGVKFGAITGAITGAVFGGIEGGQLKQAQTFQEGYTSWGYTQDRNTLLASLTGPGKARYNLADDTYYMSLREVEIIGKRSSFARTMSNPRVQKMHQGHYAFWGHPATKFMLSVLPIMPAVNGIAGSIQGAAKVGIRYYDDLINAGTKMPKVKTGSQISVKGDIDEIFHSLSKGGKQINPNQIKLPDGTWITKYPAKSGSPTLQINQAGKITKIRIE